MKYCKKCKRLFGDSEQFCPECKKHYPLEALTDNNTPVYLASASNFELDRIQAALSDSGIPNATQAKPKSISAEAVTGSNNSEMDILVPYSALNAARDVCIGIGAIKIDGEETVVDAQNIDNAENSEPSEIEELSPAKKTTVKIISAILLIILFCAVIWGTDFITGLIKGFFG